MENDGCSTTTPVEQCGMKWIVAVRLSPVSSDGQAVEDGWLYGGWWMKVEAPVGS
jgi:hypothetical protein